jgi:hypothetical protein
VLDDLAPVLHGAGGRFPYGDPVPGGGEEPLPPPSGLL